MKRTQLCLAAFATTMAVSWLPSGEVLREGAMEKMPLFAAQPATAWAPSESTILSSSRRTKGGAAAWHWHVSVDYTSGEARYPVGWPRISRAIPEGALRDWSGWDFLQMWIFTETSRADLPNVPAGLVLHTPDRAGAYSRTLHELKKGRWIEIRIPLGQVPRHHDVRYMQFHIAESNYKHGDELDFHIGELALLRYAEPTLTDFAPENAVLFDDCRRIPVTFRLAGATRGSPVPVVCELWRQGRVVARGTVQAARGPQRLVLETGEAGLPAGTYELQAGQAGQRQSAAAAVRIVESPWR